MWRFLNSISRAFKSHVHSPRPSAGLYVEEEQEALELNEKVGCPFLHRRRSVDADEHQSCSAKVFHSFFIHKKNNDNNNRHETTCNIKQNQDSTTCNIKQNQDFNTGKENDDSKRWSCHHDFWRMFQGSHRVLEALSWGSAMLLGADTEKRRHKSRLLLRVLLANPYGSTTIRSIKTGVSVNHVVAVQPQQTGHMTVSDTASVVQGADTSNVETETLDSALEEFQSMCTEYTARTESLLGIEAAVHGDFNTAVEHLRSSCALGNMSACFNLGLCYETGSGVLQDLDKAKHYYTLAAMEGHSMALYNLGLMSLRCNNYNRETSLAEAGCNCGCNKVEGLGLLEKAAQLGLAEAQTYLGIHHIEVNQDVHTAVPYFKSAAEQNDMNAQYFLAICYEQGWGVEVNECRAAQLYSLATNAGHEMAMYNLAVFNEHGLGGLPANKSAAIDLYQKSADLGCEQARQRLKDLKTSETVIDDWELKIGTFRQLYLQHHKDEDLLMSHHDSTSLSPSASSPNLTDYFHKDTPFFFGNHTLSISDSKKHNTSFESPSRATFKTRRDSHLGSDGDYDDGCMSPHSEISELDESFGSSSYEMFPSVNSLHKSHSQPNFSLGTCSI